MSTAAPQVFLPILFDQAGFDSVMQQPAQYRDQRSDVEEAPACPSPTAC